MAWVISDGVTGLLVPPADEAALAAARRVLEGLEVVGVLCVELFVLPDGGVVVNDAPFHNAFAHYVNLALRFAGPLDAGNARPVAAITPAGAAPVYSPTARSMMCRPFWRSAATGFCRCRQHHLRITYLAEK